MIAPSAINVWRCFNDCGVKYLTVGGFAVNIYGYHRATGDIGIYIEDTPLNRVCLRNAFKVIGIGDFEEIERIQFIPGWTDFSLEHGLRLDILTSLLGLEEKSFDGLLLQATTVVVKDVQVPFIDYASLIIAKRATNRPKDILDIEELEKINGSSKK